MSASSNLFGILARKFYFLPVWISWDLVKVGAESFCVLLGSCPSLVEAFAGLAKLRQAVPTVMTVAKAIPKALILEGMDPPVGFGGHLLPRFLTWESKPFPSSILQRTPAKEEG